MYIGIDIGGTKLLAAYSPDGRRLATTAVVATPRDQRQAIPAIMKLIDRVAAGRQVASIGLSAPCVIDLERRTIVRTTHLPWRDFAIARDLEKASGRHVTLQNDAACGALAEATLGSGQGHRRVLYVTISTGIGSALVLDGQIDHGRFNTEGGHITIEPDGPVCGCGGRGHFDAVASGTAIKRRFGKPAYQITDRATWDAIAADFARGLSSLAAATGPDVIVLGGGVSVHFGRFKEPLARHLGQIYPYYLPPIKLAKYVETAPVIGALQLATRSDRRLR